MASALQTRSVPRLRRTLLLPTLILAGQRARRTWRLLLLIELGLLGAILLACAVPLYANVTLTATLRSLLNGQDSSISVHTSPQLLSQSALTQTAKTLDREARRILGFDLQPAQFSIKSQPLQILVPGAHGVLQQGPSDLNLISEDLRQASAHLKLASGRLPDSSSTQLQIAITPATAQALHVSVGAVLPVQLNLNDATGAAYPQTLEMQVSAIFLPATSDYYWHGTTFVPSQAQGTHYYALLSNQALLQRFDQISRVAVTQLHFFTGNPTVTWNYQIDSAHLSINDLSTLFYGIQQIQFDNANNPALEQEPYLEQTQTLLSVPDALNGLLERLAIIEFPVTSLVILILGLLLFFLVAMITLLIEHQHEAIALLRGRGATRQQILAALVLQGIGLVIIALIAGILLAPWVVRLLTWQMFGNHDQNALNIMAGGPFQIALVTGPYALLVAGVALITMGITAWLAARHDIVSLRREAARSAHRPLWQRLRLDLVAMLIALVGYAASLYLLHSSTLDSQFYLLLLAPLSLLQALFLLLAALLLLFRFYPTILRGGTRLVESRRSAAPVLALAQIARAPRQPARLAMLLALTSAFAIFALVFSASQARRVQDVASYQAGADFSGTLPTSTYTANDVERATDLYTSIPGVLACSLGLNTQAVAGVTLNQPISVQSADASTFARAADWSDQDSEQTLASLMQTLLAQRSTALQTNVIPALVDSNAWSVLHLTQNATFTLNFSQLGTDRVLKLQVIAQVQHIPTSGNSTTPEVFLDYPTLARVFTQTTGIGLSSATIAPNAIWLHTRPDAPALASVRRALTNGNLRLATLYDRRSIEAALYADPIYLTLLGELELGAITALFLALLACLVSSWLSVRSRLLNLVTLRALGATARQVTAILAWEQGIIYTTALLLGILMGVFLSVLSLPSLILTSVLPGQSSGNVNNTNFFAAQLVPPLQVSIPLSLWFVLAGLVLLCLCALGLMLSKVTRSATSTLLRLSED